MSKSSAVTVPLQFDEGSHVAVALVSLIAVIATTVPVLASEGMATNSSLSPLKPVGTLAERVMSLVCGWIVTVGRGEPARGISSLEAFHCSSGGWSPIHDRSSMKSPVREISGPALNSIPAPQTGPV